MKIAIFILGSCLSGCSVGKYEYSKEAEKRVDMTFTGIPTIMGFGTLGTTIPLTEQFSLTAAHVARYSTYKIKARHPDCDLAVVYHKNPGLIHSPHFRNSHIGEQVNLYGYSFISALPVSSHGTNLINTRMNNHWNTADCILVATNAGVVQGMSGGAVYNASDDTLSGVIVGFSDEISDNTSGQKLYQNSALYVPYARFQAWLKRVIQ
ncbi:serine protease [Enterobacteriaceae bacterium LUAb1]